jgi:lipoic acid synthetase
MLGLGETDEEIVQTLDDLRAASVDIVTLGQYLRPTVNHLAIERFVAPADFDRYRELALERGFLECVSGPLVRSSYRAEQALNRNNAGLNNGALQAGGAPAAVAVAAGGAAGSGTLAASAPAQGK